MVSISFLGRFCQWTREKLKQPGKATLRGDRNGMRRRPFLVIFLLQQPAILTRGDSPLGGEQGRQARGQRQCGQSGVGMTGRRKDGGAAYEDIGGSPN